MMLRQHQDRVQFSFDAAYATVDLSYTGSGISPSLAEIISLPGEEKRARKSRYVLQSDLAVAEHGDPHVLKRPRLTAMTSHKNLDGDSAPILLAHLHPSLRPYITIGYTGSKDVYDKVRPTGLLAYERPTVAEMNRDGIFHLEIDEVVRATGEQAFRVYMALSALRDKETEETFVGAAGLGKMMGGLCRKTVQRAFNRLVDLGLLEVIGKRIVAKYGQCMIRRVRGTIQDKYLFITEDAYSKLTEADAGPLARRSGASRPFDFTPQAVESAHDLDPEVTWRGAKLPSQVGVEIANDVLRSHNTEQIPFHSSPSEKNSKLAPRARARSNYYTKFGEVLDLDQLSDLFSIHSAEFHYKWLQYTHLGKVPQPPVQHLGSGIPQLFSVREPLIPTDLSDLKVIDHILSIWRRYQKQCAIRGRSASNAWMNPKATLTPKVKDLLLDFADLMRKHPESIQVSVHDWLLSRENVWFSMRSRAQQPMPMKFAFAAAAVQSYKAVAEVHKLAEDKLLGDSDVIVPLAPAVVFAATIYRDAYDAAGKVYYSPGKVTHSDVIAAFYAHYESRGRTFKSVMKDARMAQLATYYNSPRPMRMVGTPATESELAQLGVQVKGGDK